MRKNEIAERIHQQTGLSMAEAATSLEWILEFIKKTLQAGESINISGFGKFTVRHKKARLGRNPRTGEPIPISPRRVVTFKTSLEFKRAINAPVAQGAVDTEKWSDGIN
ncbi:MAG: integration host factor subunit alpha [Nitrospira sp.]